MQTIFRWVFEAIVVTALTAVLKPLWRAAYLLAENAIVGWADDQIADALGIHSPGLVTIVNLAWVWGIPLLFAVLILALYHRINSWWSKRKATADKPPQEATDLITFTEAAGLVYEQASEKLRQDIRSGDGGGDGIIDRCKMFILVAASQGVAELQGRRAAGLVRETIRAQETNELFPNKGDAIGFLVHDDRYVDVAIRRSEIPNVVAYFEDEKPARPKKRTPQKPLNEKTGLVWNIEDHPENIVFLGLSVGSHGEFQAHHFATKGWNRTISPITSPRAYIRAENSATRYDALFNPGNAKLLPISKVETIPVGALIDIIVPFRPDRSPIPLATFISEFVPFTFIFESPEASYRQTITKEQIEHRIRLFQEAVNAKLVTRPQIQIRRTDDGA